MDKKAVDTLLASMVQSEKGISDLLFIDGKPPLLDVYGSLREFPTEPVGACLTADFIEKLADHLIGNNQRLLATFSATGSCDTSYTVDGVARFRVNVYNQNGRRAIVMRKFPSTIPSLEKLGLAPIFTELVKEKNGIILVTGAAGSGKTTTLAALVNELNQSQAFHILTLEDPIEFIHPHLRSAVSQRELGKDFPTFADGLRVALRQAPKVILVGEIRDRETMEIALTASETGHLVLSTLHTVNAGQSVNRILGFFNRDEEGQVRQRLADTLRYIVSQRLVSKVDGKRLLITEVLGSNLRTREALRYGECEGKTFNEIIEAASSLGWHTFDQSLLQAREANLITEEAVLTYCTNKAKVRQAMDQLNKKLGVQPETATSGLKLDFTAPIKMAPAPPAEA